MDSVFASLVFFAVSLPAVRELAVAKSVDSAMRRYLVFMIPGIYQPKSGRQVAADFSPDPKMMEAMGKFNNELKKAGALLSLDGLQPLTTGARLAFSDDAEPAFTDGPAINAKEVVGGYWLLQSESKQQVVNWMKRCPAQDGDVIEIRQIQEMSDFPADVQAVIRDGA